MRIRGGNLAICVPIKWWWDDNWETPEHWHFVAWRDAVSVALVDEGWLIYRPWEAFKGAWDDRAQSVNDLAIQNADGVVNLNLDPPVPSEGTAGERHLAAKHGIPWVDWSAPQQERDFPRSIRLLLSYLSRTVERRPVIEQRTIIDSFPAKSARIHYYDDDGRVTVFETDNALKVELLDRARVS